MILARLHLVDSPLCDGVVLAAGFVGARDGVCERVDLAAEGFASALESDDSQRMCLSDLCPQEQLELTWNTPTAFLMASPAFSPAFDIFNRVES